MSSRDTRRIRRRAWWIPALVLLACPIACHSEVDPPRRVYLVTIDTLRADHLGSYGYPRAISPFLDRLATDGVLFEQTVASSSTTMASHTSLFSSLHPPQHRLLRNGEALDESVFTMAQLFQQKGYETAAFTTVGFTRSLSRGFDTFDSEERYFPAEHVLGKASRWIETRRSAKGLFVWIHLFDVHEWYRREHLNQAFLGAARTRTAIPDRDLVATLRERQGISLDDFENEQDLFDVIGRYDDQIASVDAALGNFYSFLEHRGLDDDALWIVTGDHGEGLGSHGYRGHGGRIYNEQVRVPFVMRFPDGRFAGRRIDRLVRHVDLLPTVAEILHAPLDQQVVPVVGKSLLTLIEGGTSPERPRFAFSQRRGADARRLALGWEPGEICSLQTEDHKYILHSDGVDEFYDLRSDPLELNNLIDEPSETRDRLKERLTSLFEYMSEQGEHLGDREILPEHLEELKALGYL